MRQTSHEKGEGESEVEFKESTREESRLIYFICGNRETLKKKKKKKKTKKKIKGFGDSEKESVGSCFHEQAA